MIKQYKKPILYSILGAVLLLIAACSWLIGSIVTEANADKRQAAAVAREQTDLEYVSKVEPFAGDRAFMVVYGQSADGDEMIVWLNEEEIYVQLADDGVSEEKIRQQVEAANAGNEIIKVSLGKLQDLFVWEVFYKQTDEEKNERFFYDYYHFSDGSRIDTYRLATP
ncbi:cell wall elongation regulator TseB-like domain-containing protein [Paenibacillus senegalensis]|uniref:cell wall elongation regulator TseB-like domain-containing protein n=1 Tax=Paenibacillus senegalensis TaxID=1465766 RepID=UPI000289108D|nr:DUF5590 domain-containing protein [Paenibacillus senegalensis]